VFGQLKHAKKSLRDVFRFAPRTAIETRISRTRLRAVEKSTASSRTYSDSNPHAARTVRSKTVRVVSISFDCTLFRTRHGKVLPPTHICAFRLLTGKCQPLFAERTEKRPAGTFSHVSADSTSPPADREMSAETLLAEHSILTERTSCGLCHRAKGPAQGAFGLRWSPVPPSAQDIRPERLRLSKSPSSRAGTIRRVQRRSLSFPSPAQGIPTRFERLRLSFLFQNSARRRRENCAELPRFFIALLAEKVYNHTVADGPLPLISFPSAGRIYGKLCDRRHQLGR
jgi:hypothetical protein